MYSHNAQQYSLGIWPALLSAYLNHISISLGPKLNTVFSFSLGRLVIIFAQLDIPSVGSTSSSLNFRQKIYAFRYFYINLFHIQYNLQKFGTFCSANPSIPINVNMPCNKRKLISYLLYGNFITFCPTAKGISSHFCMLRVAWVPSVKKGCAISIKHVGNFLTFLKSLNEFDSSLEQEL